MQTLCLIGNASELTSQTRRAHILKAIDTSWSKFGSDKFDSATDTLFGDNFQESLSKRVEKETALSKAVSITRRNKKDKDAPTTSGNASYRKDRQKDDQFFRRGPPAKYGGRQGKSPHPYSAYHAQNNQRKGKQPFGSHRHTQRPLFHEPSLPSEQKTPHKRSWAS